MGVEILALESDTNPSLRIGTSTHGVGLLVRLWKLTETDLAEDRAELLDALDAARPAKATPVAVIVEGVTPFAPPKMAAHRVLGWDLGRRRTQDMDFDHLPTLGWTVEDAGGEFILHEAEGKSLVPMTEARARVLGILSDDGRFLRRGQPTIVACNSVASMSGGYYAAECEFDDGRKAMVLGESESGELPKSEWFVGKTPKDTAGYRLASQVASKR